MKFLSFTVVLALLLPLPSIAADTLPDNALGKGTLSNPQLINDAKVGVASKVATLGCKNPETFEPYVLAMPQGEAGSRYWHELWVVKGCSAEYPVKIKFNETGLTGANWTIVD